LAYAPDHKEDIRFDSYPDYQMKYLRPEEIQNNPSYIPVEPKPYVYGVSNMSNITHHTRVPSVNQGWETVLYYRFVGSITQNQPQST